MGSSGRQRRQFRSGPGMGQLSCGQGLSAHLLCLVFSCARVASPAPSRRPPCSMQLASAVGAPAWGSRQVWPHHTAAAHLSCPDLTASHSHTMPLTPAKPSSDTVPPPHEHQVQRSRVNMQTHGQFLSSSWTPPIRPARDRPVTNCNTTATCFLSLSPLLPSPLLPSCVLGQLPLSRQGSEDTQRRLHHCLVTQGT